MKHSDETGIADRADAAPVRIQPDPEGLLKRWPPKVPEPTPHRYTAATVREFPRRGDNHIFDPTW